MPLNKALFCPIAGEYDRNIQYIHLVTIFIFLALKANIIFFKGLPVFG
jgi:hypothetical protein